MSVAFRIAQTNGVPMFDAFKGVLCRLLYIGLEY